MTVQISAPQIKVEQIGMQPVCLHVGDGPGRVGLVERPLELSIPWPQGHHSYQRSCDHQNIEPRCFQLRLIGREKVEDLCEHWSQHDAEEHEKSDVY